jgi:chromosome segregation protein
MHLARVTLQGFKSYTAPVEIHFCPQISVIIGSNGVGKSNTLEGLLWALGEDDPSALRCRTSQDLLFSGSSPTPPAEEASVKITLARGDKEVALARSLKRTGEESFLVQGQRVSSLDEYRDALGELNLCWARRNVICQEKLADFCAMNSGQRKEFLEGFLSLETDLESINTRFESYLSELVPGSTSRLVVGDDGTQIDVSIGFPSKLPKGTVLLSGGERAVACLALKLALFEFRPSPVYLMDEVEPALDWTRNASMQSLLKRLSGDRQLILVTHTRSTVEVAKSVHGVRMRPDGSTWLKFHLLMDERLYAVYRCC